MVSLKNVLKLEKFIFRLALLLKKHLPMNTGVYLFAAFLEMLATYKLVGKVIARQRAIIVRRIRANQATESQERSRLNTVRSGTQNLCLVDKVHATTWANFENGWRKIKKKLSKKRKILLWIHLFYIFWPLKKIGFFLKCRNTTRKKSERSKRLTSKD